MRLDVAGLARRHWFYLAVPVLALAAFAFRTSHPWDEQPFLGEITTLFDWCLFVPALYVICYRDMPRRALMLRALALVCGGIWIASKIVPDPAETILPAWGWLRAVGLAILVVFELFAAVAMLRVVFGAAPDPEALARQGIPPLLVRLMLAEARFWRWIWARMRGR
jgi:hypothetical protein